jgi:hypothetical protein
MHHYVDIILNNGKNIKVKFLDNPFIEKFIEHLKLNYTYWEVVSWNNLYPMQPLKYVEEEVTKYTNLLKGYIEGFNKIGLNFPVPLEEIDFSEGMSLGDEKNADKRDLLNRLHRHFTTGEDSYFKAKDQIALRHIVDNPNLKLEDCLGVWQYDTDYYFNLPTKEEDLKIFFESLHGVNYAVHDIELYYTNDRIDRFRPGKEDKITREYQIELKMLPSPSEYLGNNKYMEPDDKLNHMSSLNVQDIIQNYFKKFETEDYQYFSDNLSYDVWVPLYQIQGKDYIRAFFEYDDPTCWDIHAASVFYTGSFSIGDRSMIKHPEVLEYMRSFGMDPGPFECGMPLGNVIEGKDLVPSLKENIVKELITYKE